MRSNTSATCLDFVLLPRLRQGVRGPWVADFFAELSLQQFLVCGREGVGEKKYLLIVDPVEAERLQLNAARAPPYVERSQFALTHPYSRYSLSSAAA